MFFEICSTVDAIEGIWIASTHLREQGLARVDRIQRIQMWPLCIYAIIILKLLIMVGKKSLLYTLWYAHGDQDTLVDFWYDGHDEY